MVAFQRLSGSPFEETKVSLPHLLLCLSVGALSPSPFSQCPHTRAGLGKSGCPPDLPSGWTDFRAPFLCDFLTASKAVVGAVLHQILSGGALSPTLFLQCPLVQGLGSLATSLTLPSVRTDFRALLGDFLTAFKAVVGAVLHQILVSMICLESRVVPSGGSVTHRSSNGALWWGDGAMRCPSKSRIQGVWGWDPAL